MMLPQCHSFTALKTRLECVTIYQSLGAEDMGEELSQVDQSYLDLFEENVEKNDLSSGLQKTKSIDGKVQRY